MSHISEHDATAYTDRIQLKPCPDMFMFDQKDGCHDTRSALRTRGKEQQRRADMRSAQRRGVQQKR